MSFNIAGSLFALQQLENAKHNNCIIPNDTQFCLNGDIVTLAELFAYYIDGHKKVKEIEKIEKITETTKQRSAIEKKTKKEQRVERIETNDKTKSKRRPNNKKTIDKELQSTPLESK